MKTGGEMKCPQPEGHTPEDYKHEPTQTKKRQKWVEQITFSDMMLLISQVRIARLEREIKNNRNSVSATF